MHMVILDSGNPGIGTTTPGSKLEVAGNTTLSSYGNLIFSNQGIKNISSLIVELGTSCQAIESVPFAIAVFCRNPINFRAGVLEAVNAGGDTDTIASMVGALIGANNGLDSIPKEWQEFNQTFVQARQLGLKFFDIFS